MKAREQIIDQVRKILVGPNPLPDFKQENGEEILFGDSPLKTYVTGILFPQSKHDEIEEQLESEVAEDNIEDNKDISGLPFDEKSFKDFNVTETTIESETSKVNNFKQSAIGITLCVSNKSQEIRVIVNAGSYIKKQSRYPLKTEEKNGLRSVIFSCITKDCYFRKQINSVLEIKNEELPSKTRKHIRYKLQDDEGRIINGLVISITYRMSNNIKDYSIYTVTLLNDFIGDLKSIDFEKCWYQCEFSVETGTPLHALPSTYYSSTSNEDYRLNSLLYRDVETYAIGHGCAATWDDTSTPLYKVKATSMPEYEVRPIIPAKVNANLSMKTYAFNKEETLSDLRTLCNEYEQWISKENKKLSSIIDTHHLETAKQRIKLSYGCLTRIRNGILLLEENDLCLKAFQLANRAMLMQQLHYKLPITEYKSFDVLTNTYELKNKITLPQIGDENTWYNSSKIKYGKWRAFQIAFILMNLKSIDDKYSPERKIVDLIWFPTGGGKTEAYLGLTAYTIFARRLKNPKNDGTTVIMRYTLRLLTAQQYERASSLICAIEKIRSDNPALLGEKRITIGLWVGESVTENDTSKVIERMIKIKDGQIFENVSVVLKCPWCGASMETFKSGRGNKTPGYEISPDKKDVIFRCANGECDFSHEDFGLPLNLFDNKIYEKPPTLLFSTVDKFAMLPYRAEAKSLFGGDKDKTPPELIIQDELHLITGPLGSAVGLYETLINELCNQNGSGPKIITSTATISGAKEQCNSLYACGEDNIFQFPVQGLTYRDCFFACEDKKAVGRKYMGLYGSAASSSATASIYTFAGLLYAAKSIQVEHEEERDPYWTNLSYFGSMRELGQAATWFIADIKEYLEVIYRNRMEASLPSEKRRYLYENGLAELTSRMSNDEIPKILKRLEEKYSKTDKRALDVCLATNMISVGVDIPRLGLMTVTGQPKSMAEYIQSTSRVGRDTNAPGLVIVIYNTSKSRDKSHYEKFQSQHSKLYHSIEPTSVTPFSRPMRDRALHAIFVALHRFLVDESFRNDATVVPNANEFDNIMEIITGRAAKIDKNEVEDIKKQLKKYYSEWKDWRPTSYFSFRAQQYAPLLVPSGISRPSAWGSIGWDTPTSMRSVEKECELDFTRSLHNEEGE